MRLNRKTNENMEKCDSSKSRYEDCTNTINLAPCKRCGHLPKESYIRDKNGKIKVCYIQCCDNLVEAPSFREAEQKWARANVLDGPTMYASVRARMGSGEIIEIAYSEPFPLKPLDDRHLDELFMFTCWSEDAIKDWHDSFCPVTRDMTRRFKIDAIEELFSVWVKDDGSEVNGPDCKH